MLLASAAMSTSTALRQLCCMGYTGWRSFFRRYRFVPLVGVHVEDSDRDSHVRGRDMYGVVPLVKERGCSASAPHNRRFRMIQPLLSWSQYHQFGVGWLVRLTTYVNVISRNGPSTKCRKSSDLPDYSYKKFAVGFSQWLVLQEFGHDRSEFRSNWKPRAHINAKFQKCTNWAGRDIVRLHPLLLHPFLDDDVQHQDWLQRRSAGSEFRDSNRSSET